jgi:hypothetical protein
MACFHDVARVNKIAFKYRDNHVLPGIKTPRDRLASEPRQDLIHKLNRIFAVL